MYQESGGEIALHRRFRQGELQSDYDKCRVNRQKFEKCAAMSSARNEEEEKKIGGQNGRERESTRENEAKRDGELEDAGEKGTLEWGEAGRCCRRTQ